MSFNERFEQNKIQWGNYYKIYKQQLETKLSENVNLPAKITTNINLGTTAEPLVVENTIKINDWETIVQQNIIDLSSVIQDLKNLRDEVIADTETNFNNENLNANFEQGENVDTTINTINNDINDWKSIYEYNLNKYNNRKQSVHGALMQAKENTDLYNYSVSGAVNIIAGVLILMYLIYNLYKEPSGMGTNKNAKKTTGSKDIKKPAGDIKKPAGDIKKPAGDIKKPAGDIKKPAATADIKKPPGDIKKLGTI